MSEVRDLISALLLVVGSLLSLSAAIGLLRFPDVLSRMHAATKPQVFGLMCVLLAVGLQFPGWATISTLVVILLFQMMTAPVAAHMVGRAAYRTKHVKLDTLLVDELAGAIAKADAEQTEADAEKADAENADAGQAPDDHRLGEGADDEQTDDTPTNTRIPNHETKE